MRLHPNVLETDAELAEVVRGARTVAVVGMKDEAHRSEPAFAIPQICRNLGMRVLPVNPTIESALGVRAVARLADLAEPFDLVNVFRRSDRIPALADEILALPEGRRPRAVWLQSGIRSDAAALKLAEAGMKVVQDACLGVLASRYLRTGEEARAARAPENVGPGAEIEE
jgi:predicted CoA-binding protein